MTLDPIEVSVPLNAETFAAELQNVSDQLLVRSIFNNLEFRHDRSMLRSYALRLARAAEPVDEERAVGLAEQALALYQEHVR